MKNTEECVSRSRARRGSPATPAFAPMAADALIERCIQGDDEAKARFYTDYYPIVYQAVLRKLAALDHVAPLRSEIDDIVNEVFSRILSRDCPMLRRIHKPHSLNAWLVTISQNQAVDYVRRWVSRSKVHAVVSREQEEHYAPPDAEIVRRERAAWLREQMATLSDRERLLLEMFFVQGLKFSEIADILGENLNTVTTRFRRAKLKLRKLIDKEAI